MREKETTYQSRITIGFSDKESWRQARAEHSEHALSILGHPVMEDWERPYMEMLATIATERGGTILEIGFGMGISATYIQTHPITEHLVIEANEEVYRSLQVFAQHALQPVIPLLGFWEEITHQLPSGSIDGILFDTYPLRKEDIHANHFPFFTEAYRLLKEGGVLTYYSDEAVEFSPEHREALQQAGFSDIQQRLCAVEPPPGCLYWNSPTLLAPIIMKSSSISV
jgi:guanidinoacetate N-methyltransferase